MVFLGCFLTCVSPAIAEGASVLPTVEVRANAPLRVLPERLSELEAHVIIPSGDETESMPQWLNQAGAVVPLSTGGEGAPPQFLVRGQDPAQNRYFLEGIPLTDGEYNASSWDWVPPGSVDSVEFFPGGVPVHLGGDGLGAGVHLKVFGGQGADDWVEVTGGDLGYGKIQTSLKSRSLKMGARLLRSQEDFLFFDDNGTSFNPADDGFQRRENNSISQVSVLPQWNLFDGPGFQLNALSLTGWKRVQVPGSVNQSDSGVFEETFQVLGLVGEGQNLNSDWKAFSYFRGQWQNLEMANNLAAKFPVEGSQSLSFGAGAEFLPRWQFAEPWFGVRVEKESFRGGLVTGQNFSHSRWSIPLGASLAFPWGVNKVQTAFQLQQFVYDQGDDFTLVSPRVSLGGPVSERTRWRVSSGYYHRAPSMRERYGTPNGLSPSRELRPEHAYKIEAGVDWSDWPRGKWQTKGSFTYSVQWAEDLITYLRNSQNSQVATNVGVAELHHLGGKLSTDWKETWRSTVSLGWLHTRNRSEVRAWQGKSLPHRPIFQASLQTEYRLGDWVFGYEFSWLGPAFVDLYNQRRRGGLGFHSLRLGWTGWGQLSLELRNLTDVQTAHGDLGAFQTVENNSGYPGYPAPGRRWFLNWRWKI